MSNNKRTIRTARDTIINSSNLAQMNFLRTVSHLLRRTLNYEKQVSDSMKQELSLLEDSHLRIHRCGNNTVFTSCPFDSSHEIGITRDSARIHKLARRAYLESCVAANDLHMKRIQRILDASDIALHESRLISKLGKFANAGLDLSRILFTEEQNLWIDQTFTPNPFHEENLNYATRGGVLMRSKSEAIIGSYFETIGLPYRPDDLVNIISNAYDEQPYRDNYFADFKAPNLLGGITIHEHFGAFQIDHYSQNALQRLNDYHSFKVVELPGRYVRSEEFTWSFEHDISQPKGLEIITLKMLLPGIY